MHESHRSAVPAQVVCIGSAALDMVMQVPVTPGHDERVAAPEAILAGGGPAATAAVALSRLGVPVAFVGRIGADQAGDFIRDDLEQAGVDTELLQTEPGIHSPMSACLVQSDGTRALVAFGGPAASHWPLSPAIAAACRSARWIHVDQAGWQLAAQLRAAGVDTPLSVDGGNPIPDLDLAIVTLYVPGRRELCRWTAEPELEDALRAALDAGATQVVATDGASGSVGRTADSVIRQPAFPAAGPSTLGAGDVYHGALLAALLDGRDLAGAITFASAAAAISCRGLDGRSGIPSRAEVEALIETSAVGLGQ